MVSKGRFRGMGDKVPGLVPFCGDISIEGHPESLFGSARPGPDWPEQNKGSLAGTERRHSTCLHAKGNREAEHKASRLSEVEWVSDTVATGEESRP